MSLRKVKVFGLSLIFLSMYSVKGGKKLFFRNEKSQDEKSNHYLYFGN